MIKVERTACPASLDPTSPQEAGPRELQRVLNKLNRGEKITSDDFTAYSSRAVREALRVMFHGKCAYCESKIAGSQDADVEHYRPKGGVTEAKEAGISHPGYWWLAMVWENLVLSCQHCNQSRSYHVIIPDDVETEEELQAFLELRIYSGAGKLNAFPTENSQWVTSQTGNVAIEKPLILNPVDVDPDEHIDWVLFGGAATVRAKNSSLVGETTRRILGLNRRWLEEDRRIRLLELRDERDNIIEGINWWLEAEDPAEQERWAISIDRAIDRLKRKTEGSKPFSGMARAFFAKVAAEVEEMQTQP